ncbi:uncharacterized protein EV420DRAFT_1727857 [Desarmillaria tabescens]|uniref:Uncharacterized protein n=1 Tax=Armillaria tabescens TaxID=1929756 RepID=A0AA39JHB6_ARMTA|nr:uncharacterized protein EV420DRAFT_1727857 [Desarmillaria tabescens]KAK0441776.1 hypothetical protein EV420DRAFT_1727857 [Desarmillaria tabescens]
MLSTDRVQSLLVVHDHTPPLQNSARPRQPSGPPVMLVWAPQPQPSESTWPKTLDSLSRVVEKDIQQQSLSSMPITSRTVPMITREDTFRPAPSVWTTKGVGAIGDGRKKNSLGDFDDSHVERLLRTLNLNSPTRSFSKSLPSISTSRRKRQDP